MIMITLSAAGFLAAWAIYACFRRAPRALVVLTYEKTGSKFPSPRLKKSWTKTARLERTLQTLSRRGFKTVLPGDLSKGRLPAKPVMLAFMGGYQSFYTDVFPLLKKYGTKACVFLAQEYIGSYNAWQNPYEEPWQNMLTEAEIKTLKDSGLVQFGALDLKARDLTALPPEEASFGLAENIFRLKKQLGIEVHAAAFWPAANWNDSALPSFKQELNGLALLTPKRGRNEPKKKTKPLKTLRGDTWRAAWALWQRR